MALTGRDRAVGWAVFVMGNVGRCGTSGPGSTLRALTATVTRFLFVGISFHSCLLKTTSIYMCKTKDMQLN